MLGLSGIANWKSEDFERMNNVIVVHVDSDCQAKTPVVKDGNNGTMQNHQQPGPSNSTREKSAKTFSESDSIESEGMSANDIRLPPPPPPIDVQALQAAILNEVDDTEVRPPSSSSMTSGISYRQCTSYRLDPPLQNPVDLTVGHKLVAIADYDNGVHFVDFQGRIKRHFVSEPYRICGVRFSTDGKHIILLAYLEQKWSVMIKTWPYMEDVRYVDCPLEPSLMTWARRKITIVGDMLYLFGTCDSCTVIWVLNLLTYTWKTAVVERASSKKSGITSSLSNSLRGTMHTGDDNGSAYSDFDAQQWTDTERRVLLCHGEKSFLKILCFDNGDKLLHCNTIKVKRRKNQQWIVKGPQLASYDNEQDIIVYDGSGKLFWFNGSSYRIQKIIGDVGKSEVCALEVSNGWCYALCRHRLCVHAFRYRF